MDNEIASEKPAPESSPEATLPVVEAVAKTNEVVEIPAAPTQEDFAKLTPKQQGEVMREMEKLKAAPAGESKKALYPNKKPAPSKKEVVAEVEPDVETPPHDEAEKKEPEVEENLASEKKAPDADGDEDADDLKDAKGKQFRLRGKDQKENDVLALVRGGRTLEDAYRMIYGAPKTDAPAKDEPPIEVAFDKDISALQSEITSLEAEQETAAQEADVAKALKIARQITAKERAIENKQMAKELALSEREQTVQQTAADREKQIVKDDYAAAVADYPELGDSKSAEHKKFSDFIREKRDDPRYEGKFASLHWRSTLAHEFAAKTGLRPADQRTAFEPPVEPVEKKTVAPVKSAPPPPPKTASQATAAKALTTKDAPSDKTFELTPDQAVQDFGKLTLKQQTEVLRELDKIKRKQNPRAA